MRFPLRHVFAFALVALPACGPSGPIVIDGKTMGTGYRVTLLALPEGESRSSMKQHIDVELDRVEQQMSTYRPRSELTRFNKSDSTDWFRVSLGTVIVANEARQIAIDSGGALDPTVGPLVRLWHFGAGADGAFAVPSDDAIAAAKAKTGYRKFEVYHKPTQMKKSDAALEIDLSAIAKGFGVDQVAEILDRRDVADYFIEIGGEIRTKGHAPGGRPWRIGIEQPLEGTRDVLCTLEAGTTAIATSGDYRNYHEHDGTRYGHTIDPRTGRPVTHALRSVTVADPLCLRADGWATALMVLGPEAGYTLAETRDIAALFVTRADDGSWRMRRTPAFVERFGNDR